MKLVSFLNQKNEEQLGLCVNDEVFNLHSTMADFLKGEEKTFKKAKSFLEDCLKNQVKPEVEIKKILACVPHPTSLRDAYAFKEHVENSRKNRGLPMVPEFEKFPVFYFSNHNAIVGAGVLTLSKTHFKQLDFELEVACVIGKKGKNIKALEADSYILGFSILNDFSERSFQMEEMKLGLGPHKGKDFATALGPWLVTKDELSEHMIHTPYGNHYDLEMKAFHNGKQVSEGNLKTMHWTFAQIIERASLGVELYPGDVIGSGTVGSGCFFELNGKNKKEVWLKPNDVIELEVEKLGLLAHTLKIK